MSETYFEELKRYVRFDDAAAAALRRLAPIAAPHYERITAEFYERVREHEAAHAVFTGEAQIERLKRSLVRWMQRLCEGPHDEAYFLERSKIGRVHVSIGLPQRYMFTAMALIRDALDAIAAGLDPSESSAARRALGRALDLELAIMLESYREDFVARIQRVERVENERLERALARSESRYHNAVELADVLVVGLDARGAIALFNRQAERVSSYARDEALGQRFVSLLVPEALQTEAEAVLARQSDTTASWEAPMRTRSGKERTILWQLAHVSAEAQDDVSVFVIGRDVSDERSLQERTVLSERLAAVGTLAAGLAHEIRNPLNGALLHVTYLERALRRDGGDAESLEAAAVIGVEIQRLSALVKDFLVFARPAPPKLASTSISALCRRVIELLLPDAKQAEASFVEDFAAVDLVLQLDAPKIEQALLNLLRNAVDAVGAEGGGTVTVRTRRLPRHALLEIEDDGAGLPSGDAPIFDAFYTTKPQGTGLGLAIVHRIVSDHGGSIEVESAARRTVFRMKFPIFSAEAT